MDEAQRRREEEAVRQCWGQGPPETWTAFRTQMPPGVKKWDMWQSPISPWKTKWKASIYQDLNWWFYLVPGPEDGQRETPALRCPPFVWRWGRLPSTRGIRNMCGPIASPRLCGPVPILPTHRSIATTHHRGKPFRVALFWACGSSRHPARVCGAHHL